MFWKILTIIVLIIIHKFLYDKAFDAKRNSFKEFIFMILTIFVTITIAGIIFTIIF